LVTGNRILVVDDDTGILTAVERSLTKLGWVVRGTSFPKNVEGMIRKEKFDMALLDIVMPGMDGLALLRIVQKAAPDLPVIMMTGYIIPENITAAVSAGTRGFLAKPFTPEELREEVERVLRQSKA
jgi:two-component system phosphate regulon response regulator OmpR